MLFNLDKQDKKSRQITPKFRLYLALLNSIDFSKLIALNATVSENVLKENEKWTYIDATSASINPAVAPGESPLNGQLTLTPNIEGISKKSLQWIYDNTGEEVIAVWIRCSDNQKFIGGSECSNGLKLTYTNIGLLDGGVGGIALQLQGEACPEPFYFYEPAEFPIEDDVPENP